MAYEYEGYIKNTIRTESVFSHETEQKYYRMLELQEVYRKAKAFDEIVIETTGAIMNCPPGAVETEAGRITLDIIEKYDLEDE